MIPGLLLHPVASPPKPTRPAAKRANTNRRESLPSQLPGSWAQDPGCTAVLFDACRASAAS
jgi:hypothetical protein